MNAYKSDPGIMSIIMFDFLLSSDHLEQFAYQLKLRLHIREKDKLYRLRTQYKYGQFM